jgi:hypothetical protein
LTKKSSDKKRASLRLYFQRDEWKESQYERCTGLSFCVLFFRKSQDKDDRAVFNLGSWFLFLLFNPISLQNRNLQSYRLLQTCPNHLDLNRLQISQNHLHYQFSKIFPAFRHFTMRKERFRDKFPDLPSTAAKSN